MEGTQAEAGTHLLSLICALHWAFWGSFYPGLGWRPSSGRVRVCGWLALVLIHFQLGGFATNSQIPSPVSKQLLEEYAQV